MFKWIKGILGEAMSQTSPPASPTASPAIAPEIAPVSAAEIYLQQALPLAQNREFERAIQILSEGIQHFPTRWDFHFFLGNLYFETRQFSSAIDSYRSAVRYQPEAIEAYANLGLALQGNGQIDEAIACLQEALAINPEFPGLHNNLGTLYVAKRNFADATVCLEKALQQQPHSIDILKNLAFVYFSQDELSRAILCIRRAVVLDPGRDDLYVGIGELQLANAEFEKAFEQFNRAVGIAPESLTARANRGSAYILMGDLKAAWADFRIVMRSGEQSPGNSQQVPLWLNDSDLKGKAIHIYADEGLGDTLQTVRYIDMVKAMGAEVVLQVQSALKPLLQHNGPVSRVYAANEAVPPTDFRLPISALPVAFDTDLTSIPLNIPYVFADPGKIEAWSQKLKNDGRPRIGLIWSGNPQFKNDAIRSARLENLLPLIDDQRFQFLSLQKDLRDIDRTLLATHANLVDLGPHLADFAETAAIVANLDLVISVDTSTAHLTGAMGRPIWIMLPFSPDRRWMLDVSESPWYPSARLFRQKAPSDWAGLMEAMKTELERTFASRLA